MCSTFPHLGDVLEVFLVESEEDLEKPQRINTMMIFEVTVYDGLHSQRIEVKATNQAHLKQRVKGMGYERLGAIHKTRPA